MSRNVPKRILTAVTIPVVIVMFGIPGLVYSQEGTVDAGVIDQPTKVVLPEEATTTPEEISEPVDQEESLSPSVVVQVSVPPPLLARKLKKSISIDAQATHSCGLELFKVDISGQASATGRMILNPDADVPYEAEIGSLPAGIDLTFSQNGQHSISLGHEKSLDLDIVSQPGSQKGDFNILLIYVQKGARDSSVVCQMNIVNR